MAKLFNFFLITFSKLQTLIMLKLSGEFVNSHFISYHLLFPFYNIYRALNFQFKLFISNSASTN